MTLTAFRALAGGHAEADDLREARFLAAVRVAVNGSAEEVGRFLDRDGGGGGGGGGGGFAGVDEALAGFGMVEDRQ